MVAGQRACPSCGLPFPSKASAAVTTPPPRSRRRLLTVALGAAVSIVALVSFLVLSSGPPALEPRWRLQAGGGAVVGAPEVDGGTLFGATRDGALVAVEAETGEAQWRFETGERILASPLAEGGLVYVATESFDTPTGQVFSVDARTGAEQWRSELEAPLRGPPAIVAGLVLLPAGDVVALDALTGEERWRQALGVDAELLVAGTDVVVAAGPGGLVALDVATGDQRWAVSATGSAQVAPVIAGGTLVVGDVGGALVGRDLADGAERWRLLDIGRVQAPVVAGQVVALATTDGVVALDSATGERRWLVALDTDDADAENEGVRVATDGTAVAATAPGRLSLLDAASGEVLGEADLAGEGRATPTVASGRVYVAEGETVTAFHRPAA